MALASVADSRYPAADRRGSRPEGLGRDRPSEEVRELIRRGAQISLDDSAQWLENMQDVALASSYARRIADDPVIVQAIRRSTRECCLRWVAENVSHSGEPVSANITVEELVAVRNVVSRGLDELAITDAYRLAQNAAVQNWIHLAFQLTSEPRDLRELLDVCQRSIAAFIGAVVAELCQMIRSEREQLKRGTNAAVHEIVGQIIDGGSAPANSDERLNYPLGQEHTAIVLWSDQLDVDDAALDRVTHVLMDSAAGLPAFMMQADPATRWVWVSGSDGPELTGVAAVLTRIPGVHIAVGPTSPGVAGFRRSHLDALTAQRLVAKTGHPGRLVRFTEIEVLALAYSDTEQADRFIERTLGAFALADAELRRTVLTFIHERYSASRTAARLFIHRNTLYSRLAQAEELLPQPLDDAHVRIAIALEILSWKCREPALDLPLA